MTMPDKRRVALWFIALVSIGYACVITYANLAHIRSMPVEERSVLSALNQLPSNVQIVERNHQSNGTAASDESLVQADVFVMVDDQAYPVSRDVWVNASSPVSDPARYLHRFRIGTLSSNEATKLPDPDARVFLLEVHQRFASQGDNPRVNIWLFPSASLTESTNQQVEFAHNISLSSAMDASEWRALFADNHRRLVRAFPALAAFLIGLAAIGSLLFTLWRVQTWSVFATTLTFVLPIVSAAPFLTAFGWLPILAPVVLGFVLTVAIVSAVEQRFMPTLRQRIKRQWLRHIIESLLIPFVALLIGTGLVVSFASVSVIEWQGLGSASPGEIFMQSLARPAAGLLAGGTSAALVMSLFYWLLNLRRRQRLAALD